MKILPLSFFLSFFLVVCISGNAFANGPEMGALNTQEVQKAISQSKATDQNGKCTCPNQNQTSDDKQTTTKSN